MHKLEIILISHLHGDHIFGLPGLLNSMNLTDRKKKLLIFGPEGITEFVKTILSLSGYDLRFDVEIKEYSEKKYQRIFTARSFEIYNFPLEHRIQTYGYKIRELNHGRNIDPQRIKEFHLNFDQIRAVKEGRDIEIEEGRWIKNTDLTLPSRKLRSYAYCSDTMFDTEIVPYIKNVDLLYHESTYLSDLKDKARLRFHSTAEEAGQIAHLAGVGKLILGHFSSRYSNLNPFLEEAKMKFKNVELAIEGRSFKVNES